MDLHYLDLKVELSWLETSDREEKMWSLKFEPESSPDPPPSINPVFSIRSKTHLHVIRLLTDIDMV